MIKEGAYATVIAIFQQQYLKGKPLTVTGNGEQRRDFTHINDIVDGLIKCVDENHKAEEFELGTGVNYSINELAEMFDCDKTYIPARQGEYDVTLCDYSKAEKHLGYKPNDNLKKYITKWLEENKNV
jgi:UDP-glucose 4-epimerase